MGKRFYIQLSFLFLVLVLLFVVDILLGSVSVPFREMVKVFFSSEHSSIYYTIVHDFRLPKAFTAVLAGAALSTCGLQMQTLFKNPLAGPFVLGINAGASLAVAIVLMGGGITLFSVFKSASILVFAALGACTMLLLILLLAGKIRDNISLLLVGVMIGHLTSSVEGVLQYFSRAESLQSFVLWSLGSFSNVAWEKLFIIFPVIIAALLVAFLNSKSLNALLMGENYAQTLGVNLARNRFLIILSSGTLAGTITAFCGPIAFIGMAVPHLARGYIKTSDHRILLPITALTGAALAVFCDIVSQSLLSNTVLPVNAITSLIGAPLVIGFILKRKHLKA